MKIISKYKDYYDHIGHEFGEDPKIIFNRQPIDHNDDIIKKLNDIFRYSKYRAPNTKMHGMELYQYRWIVINGHVWLLSRLNGTFKQFSIATQQVFDHVKQVEKENKLYHYYGSEKLVADDFMNITEFTSKLIEIHKKLGTPIFAFDGDGFGDVLSTSNGVKKYKVPLLTDYGFASYYPSYQIFQDLCHFIGNELRDAPDTQPPVEISDPCKIEGHGFDKKISFRHRKNTN